MEETERVKEIVGYKEDVRQKLSDKICSFSYSLPADVYSKCSYELGTLHRFYDHLKSECSGQRKKWLKLEFD